MPLAIIVIADYKKYITHQQKQKPHQIKAVSTVYIANWPASMRMIGFAFYDLLPAKQ